MPLRLASAVSASSLRCAWRRGGALVLALGFLHGCGEPQPEYRVRGADRLARGEAGAEALYDIIAYPLNEDELSYFLSNLDPFLQAVEPHAASWAAVQSMPDPTRSMREHPVWELSGIRCEDFMAAYAKLDFMSGYFESEPLRPAELDETIGRLERAREGEADPELDAAIAQLRQL